MQTVFYSWQSDRPNRVNRGFIGGVLDRVVRELNGVDPSRFELDSDTRDTPGAPHIVQTILGKIERAGVFVAGVTPVVLTPQEQTDIPNPNVMFETGYALKVLGPERIVTVVNEAFAPIARLPFDLSHRRAVGYTLPETDTDLATVRNALLPLLIHRVREAMPPLVPLVGPTELELPTVAEGGETKWELPRTSLGTAEQAWLEIVARAFDAGETPDYMLVRAHRDRLGTDFRPFTIPRLLVGDGRDITPIGLWHADPLTPWLTRVDRLFRYIKQLLAWNPRLGPVRVSALANKLGFSAGQTSNAVHLLRTCHGWACSGSSSAPDASAVYPPMMSVISLNDERVLRFYEAFTTLQDVMYGTLLAAAPPREF